MIGNLFDLIKEHPTINITVKGCDLLQFGLELASQTARNVLQEHKEILYTRAETMDKFDICAATIWRWRKLGLIKGKKIGHRIYYAESEIKSLLANK